MARKPDPNARGKLLAAARAAFAENGVERARVEDISSAAGLSKGAFYLHFESKDEALDEILGGFFELIAATGVERLAAREALLARVGYPDARDWEQGSERLQAWRDLDRRCTTMMLETLWAQRDILRILLHHRLDDLQALTELGRAQVHAELRMAIEAGHCRSDIDPAVAGDLLTGMYLQLGRRMVAAQERPDFESWARTIDTVVVEGIAHRPSRKEA